MLNDEKVRLYLESSIMQPSSKVGMFLDTPWWRSGTKTYRAKIEGNVVNTAVIQTLSKQGFDPAILSAICGNDTVMGVAFTDSGSLLKAAEQVIRRRLTIRKENALEVAATRETIGG